uniref:Uncharacterized protein n=1 Tax=Gasterosteus aculeatus TaxID=69293 RepID=G3NA87_GASAC
VSYSISIPLPEHLCTSLLNHTLSQVPQEPTGHGLQAKAPTGTSTSGRNVATKRAARLWFPGSHSIAPALQSVSGLYIVSNGGFFQGHKCEYAEPVLPLWLSLVVMMRRWSLSPRCCSWLVDCVVMDCKAPDSHLM